MFLRDWLKRSNIEGINIQSYLNYDRAMKKVSFGFFQTLKCVLKVVIGAIDGWLVHTRRPSWFIGGIKSPIAFFSRKGFYELNLQCIVDNKKDFYGCLILTMEPRTT